MQADKPLKDRLPSRSVPAGYIYSDELLSFSCPPGWALQMKNTTGPPRSATCIYPMDGSYLSMLWTEGEQPLNESLSRLLGYQAKKSGTGQLQLTVATREKVAGYEALKMGISLPVIDDRGDAVYVNMDNIVLNASGGHLIVQMLYPRGSDTKKHMLSSIEGLEFA